MTAPAEASDSRRRLTVLAGVGAALVLALLLGSKLMAGGGGDDTATSTSRSSSRTASARTGTSPQAAPATPAAPQAPATAETFEVFTTKNPFVALRTTTKAAPAPAARPTVSPAAVTATPAVATATPTATPAVATTGVQATEPSRSTIRVAVLDVFTDGGRTVANVRVNDTVSKVGAGDAFATNFKVVSLDAATRCGRFLFSDDQFQLCKGEEVLK